MKINELFFELIQVAIGTRICLSHTPSADEWGELYSMAKKQSLVGVCFAGVQKLVNQRQEPPEILYLTWMGMAAKIQQRNEVVNKQCMELQAKLSADGMQSCILKGQSNLHYYGALSMLRQSGDIDVWMYDDVETVLKYVNKVAKTDEVNELHVHFHAFDDTEVELHFVPTVLSNKIANKKLQRWLEVCKDRQFDNVVMLNNGQKIYTSTTEFNLVYQLIHIYRHLFSEGIGLRQLMDYHMVLRSSKDVPDVQSVTKTISDLGLNKFASALMWVLQRVFGLSMIGVPWTPNQREGEFLLKEIMQMGNFGHTDERFKLNENDSHIKRFCQMVVSKWRFVEHFPLEVLWQPVEIVTRFFDIRRIRRMNKKIQNNKPKFRGSGA